MDINDVYKTPESSLCSEPSNKPSVLNIVLVILLTLPLMAISFFRQTIEMEIAGGVGGAIGALIPAFLVVAIFQIGKRFRNSKSRWKIYGWSQLVFLLGQVTTVLQLIGQNA